MKIYKNGIAAMTLISLATFAAPSEAAWWKRSKAPARDLEAQSEPSPSALRSRKDSARSKKSDASSIKETQEKHAKHLRDSVAHIDHVKALGVVAGLTATAAVATDAAGHPKATAALKCVSGVCATLAGAKGIMHLSSKEKARHAEHDLGRIDRKGRITRPSRVVRRARVGAHK